MLSGGTASQPPSMGTGSKSLQVGGLRYSQTSKGMCAGVATASDLNDQIWESILEFLWFKDLSQVFSVCKRLSQVSKSEKLGLFMLENLSSRMHRRNGMSYVHISPKPLCETSLLVLARRLSSWPTDIDIPSLVQVPRNVTITRLESGEPCIVYGGRRKESHKGNSVMVTNDHLPCLPGAFTQPRQKNEGKLQAWERLPRLELQKAEQEGVVCRAMAPFTRLVQISPTQQVVTLSCISYFEVSVHPNPGYSAMDSLRRFSIGIACALFPLRKKQPGSDNYSFAYSRNGHFLHGNRTCGRLPAFHPGDTVGCGLMYPPLTVSQNGKIFFTKNGELVGTFDLAVEGLLSLPWFPVVGLAPSIPMAFNFGTVRAWAFDVLAFERRQLQDHVPEATLDMYSSIVAQQEASLWVPRHPLFLDPFAGLEDPIEAPDSSDLLASAMRSPCSARRPMRGRSGSCGSFTGSFAGNVGGLSRSGSPKVSPSGGTSVGDGSTSLLAPQSSNSSCSSASESHAEYDADGEAASLKSLDDISQPASTSGYRASASCMTPQPLLPARASLGRQGPSPALGGAGSAVIRRQWWSSSSSHASVQGADHHMCLSSRASSLYLDRNLRTATLLGITDTRKVTFGGSDASWEGTGEDDSEDEDDASAKGLGGYSSSLHDFEEPFHTETLFPRSEIDTGLRLGIQLGMLGQLARADAPSLGQDGVGAGSGSTHPVEALLGGAVGIGRGHLLTSILSDGRGGQSHEECADSMAVELSSADGDSIGGTSTVGGPESTPVAAPAEMSLGEFMAVANAARVAELLQPGRGGREKPSNDLDDDSDDQRSIATSLFVEVASVDEAGSYVGYGASIETEEEDEEDDDDAAGSVAVNCSSNDSRVSMIGAERGRQNGTLWAMRGGVDGSSRQHTADMQFLRNLGTGPESLWDREHDRDADGYDGATEGAGTDADIGEERDDFDAITEEEGEYDASSFTNDEGSVSVHSTVTPSLLDVGSASAGVTESASTGKNQSGDVGASTSHRRVKRRRRRDLSD